MATAKSAAALAITAAQRGDLAALRRFLNTSRTAAEAVAIDSMGRNSTLLHAASRGGQLKAVRLLIEYDCRVNTPHDNTGDTPLILAVSGGHEDVAEELLNHEKCHYNAQNNEGFTALMLAARGGFVKALDQLLIKGPDLELETLEDGETALTLAVAAGQDEAVRMLVEFGAQIEHRNGHDFTPLELAWSLPDEQDSEAAAEDKDRRDGRKRRIIEALSKQRVRARGGRMMNRAAAEANESSDDDQRADEFNDEGKMLIVGRYKNLGPLGSGAHGLALLVRDMRSNRGGRGLDSRLKVLKRISRQRQRGLQDDSGRRQDRELLFLKQMDHSCVLSLLDYFNDEEDKLCLVTEYCTLRDLHTWIQWACDTDISLPFRLVTHWLLQMLLGLSYLHDLRIVHGDFKPSNVFVQADATLRIGDFGCSLQLLDAEGCEAGALSGTWIYMSPEMIENADQSTASDMWSLGCTLYELCTCQPLFDPNLPGPSLRAKICGETDRKFDLSPLLPPWVPAALPRLLHRSPPSERPTAAALLLEENVAKSLREMQPDQLAEDRQFLADNLAGVMEMGDDEAAKRCMPNRGVDYSQAYNVLLADVDKMFASPGHADPTLTEMMKQLEDLRAKLIVKKNERNFPLDQVYDLLSRETEEQVTRSAGAQARQHLERQLAKLTADTEGCEMVQLAILLESQCLP